MKPSDFREKFSNVGLWFKKNSKKLDIGVLQRGISAPQVIRKENRKAQIAQSRKEPKGSFLFGGARAVAQRQNSIIPPPAEFVK